MIIPAYKVAVSEAAVMLADVDREHRWHQPRSCSKRKRLASRARCFRRCRPGTGLAQEFDEICRRTILRRSREANRVTSRLSEIPDPNCVENPYYVAGASILALFALYGAYYETVAHRQRGFSSHHIRS